MRRAVACILWLILGTGTAAPLEGGTLQGRVELVERKGRKARDLSGVVVWVDGPEVKAEPVTRTVTMKMKTFEPPLVVVPVGGTVSFPNLDPILHNAFSVSGKNKFDLDLYKRPRSKEHTFKYPGIVKVYCNIHPQMSAHVVVRDNPFWAEVRQDGRFSIADVPPGTWTVTAWHARAKQVGKTVTVPEDGAVSLTLTLDAAKYRRIPHRNKYGKKYKRGRY